MKEVKKGSGGGLLIMLAIVIGFYAAKGGVSNDDEAEMAEEEALYRMNGGSSSQIEDEETNKAMDGLYDSSVNSTSALEVPLGNDHGMLISHEGYQLSYDTINHNPFWVAWQLTANESRGRVGRAEEFLEDPDIPARHSVRPYAYSNSGYTRGHMCPAGDQKWSQTAMNECFYMTNMCPQTAELNRYWWDWLERAERQWAKEEGSVYIACGPIYDKGKRVKPLKQNKFFVGIPDRFFKVILSTRKGHEKAIGFIYLNDESKQRLEDCVYDVDDIERITGYDFFSPLEDQLEGRLEASADLSDWGNVPMPNWEN